MVTNLLLVCILAVLVVAGLRVRGAMRHTADRLGDIAQRATDAVILLDALKRLEADEAAQRSARIQALLTARGSGREQLRERLAQRLAASREEQQP